MTGGGLRISPPISHSVPFTVALLITLCPRSIKLPKNMSVDGTIQENAAMHNLYYGICTKLICLNMEIALTNFMEFILGVLGVGICTNRDFGICTTHLLVWNMH